MEEKSDKGLVRAAAVQRIGSVAPTTGCTQLCSFCVVLDTFFQKVFKLLTVFPQ